MRKLPLYIAVIIFGLSFVASPVGAASKGPKRSVEARCAGAATVSLMGEVPVRSTLTWREARRLKRLKKELKKDGVDAETVEAIFTNPDFGLNDAGVKLDKNNPEKKVASGETTYQWYKRCFGFETRIARYKEFMAERRDDLAGAEEKYGVDARYIVSILGVESDFSNDRGRFRAVNALVTQYLLVKRRRAYAYRQLKELIEYAKRTGSPLYGFTSSYMGAIGCGQFIPSSLNYYFVGEGGDIDEADPYDLTDCIYSIAYYLKRSRWDRTANGKTPEAGSKNWKAIRAYNHSDAYTRFVIETAESLTLK